MLYSLLKLREEIQVDLKTLRIPHIKTRAFGHRSYSYDATSVWNSLPREIRHIQSTTAFKTAPKTHLFKSYLSS